MQPLNAIEMKLAQKAVIEASAGTGKTYTIASLYLRFIAEQPLEASLSSRDLLVVTFTRAATAELRDRIRQRLHQAVACFKGKKADGDEVIQYLLDQYEDQRPLILKRLYAAEKSMDEAAIFTIHGFCQRALAEFSAVAGLDEIEELVEGEDELVLQACQDFWRELLYPLQEASWQVVQKALTSPEALKKNLYALLSRKSLSCHPAPSGLPITEFVQNYIERDRANAEKVNKLLDRAQSALLFPGLNKRSADAAIKRFEAIQKWSENPQSHPFPVDAFSYLIGVLEKNEEKLSAAGHDPEAVRALFTEAEEAEESTHSFVKGLMSEALTYVKNRISHEKALQRICAPDDLMVRLEQALTDPNSGAELAELIKARYPVAMIDEFQDTDPLQYNIFNRIYGNASDFSWLMIGDPKQSIYAFRGGDIRTYVKAKTGTDEKSHYTLSKNFRSGLKMIQATNALFSFCDDAPFMDEQISFDPVESQDQGDKGRLRIDGAPIAPLRFWQFEADESVGQQAAEQCASEIVLLLNKAASRAAQFGDGSEHDKPVAPGDIAVLVHHRFEAEAITKALRKRGVRSVYLSRESVYGTEVAKDLNRVIRAFHHPKQERQVLAALATRLCGKSAAEIAQIRDDELLWQAEQQNFIHYQQIWQKQGILTAIQQWMFDYKVPARLLADQLQGERELADLRHIAELLQIEAQRLDTTPRLLNHFDQMVAEPDSDNKVQQLRLESDSKLVQIVTIHGSKGLEYPIVMLPFGLGLKVAKEAIFSGENGTTIDFTASEGNLKLADLERQAEDMRLLYVAITRAKHACYIGLAQLFQAEGKCALTTLLNCANGITFGEEGMVLEPLLSNLQQLINQEPSLTELLKAAPNKTLLQEQQAQEPDYQAKIFSGTTDNGWRLTSYSGLSAQHDATAVVPGVSDEPEAPPKEEEAEETPQVEIPTGPCRFTFEKGARAGNALHDVLEHYFSAKQSRSELSQMVTDSLGRSGFTECELWQPVVTEWMEDLLNTPLPLVEKTLRLKELAPSSVQPEMEFYLRVANSNKVTAQRINQLFTKFPLLENGIAVRGMAFEPFFGMMKGFIDLTFEVDGCYYVCDYKSNHLGYDTNCYSQQAMQEAMADHRYDAQLIFYTLALHRYLSAILPDYDYERHIGGGIYLFLRGMSGENAGATGIFQAKPERELIEQLDQLLEGESA